MMSGFAAFRALALEAVRDTMRRRVGPFALAACLLALLAVQRCSGVEHATFTWNGMPVDPDAVARGMGPLLFGGTALFLLAIVAFVASDALAAPLSDGTALLWLARPVGRAGYAGARLTGALALSAGAGAVVLAVTGLLLHLRHGLALEPGLVGIGAFLLGSIVVGALAMTLSLHLPRVVTLFGLLLWLQTMIGLNLAHLFGASLAGSGGWMERFGPPLGTALLFAVSPWTSVELPLGGYVAVALRLALWAVGSVLLLLAAFRRLELAR